MSYIKEIESLRAFLKNGTSLKNCTVQDLDLRPLNLNWRVIEIENTTFLGCQMSLEHEIELIRRGAIILKSSKTTPYKVFRKKLYSWEELLDGYKKGMKETLDFRIYSHFIKNKYNPTINDALWQRIHDHAMDDALWEYIGMQSDGKPIKKCIGIMGGHNTLRTSPNFRKTALTAKLLTEHGFLVTSGGGPGIMEAANLGAYFAGMSNDKLSKALNTLSEAPQYSDRHYIEKGIEVLNRFPSNNQSLAIPTWFYGHEPTNVFATHIAKYFSNSIREDNLLAICIWGIVFAPGGAGTLQEIFMDAAQNHYGTYGYYSPMVFLGSEHYEIKTMLFPLIKQLSWKKPYGKMVFLGDTPDEIVKFIRNHPPVKS